MNRDCGQTLVEILSLPPLRPRERFFPLGGAIGRIYPAAAYTEILLRFAGQAVSF